MEHHDRAVFDGQSAEGALELVPIVDLVSASGVRLLEYHEDERRTPGSSPVSFL